MKISILRISDFNLVNVDKLIKHISLEKQTRVSKFLKRQDKIRGILGELLIRKMLVDEFNINNDYIIFSHNKYGKPYLPNRKDIYFNISHSGEYVVGAVDIKPIGIDIEEVKDIDFLEIVKSFFSKAENEYILESNKGYYIEKQKERFYEIWTLKESFVKCIGKGLNMDFNNFTINIHNENNIILSNYDNSESFSFKEINIDGYKLSICFKENENIEDSIQFISLQDILKYWNNN